MCEMTAREICEYIAFIDYHDYHAFLNGGYGMISTRGVVNVIKNNRRMRHIMYVIAFNMILGGDYFG